MELVAGCPKQLKHKLCLLHAMIGSTSGFAARAQKSKDCRRSNLEQFFIDHGSARFFTTDFFFSALGLLVIRILYTWYSILVPGTCFYHSWHHSCFLPEGNVPGSRLVSLFSFFLIARGTPVSANRRHFHMNDL